MPILIHLNDIADPTAKLFGERLKLKRKQLGLTQADLGRKANVTATYISQTERGLANPTLEIMVRLADAVASEAWDLLRPPQ